MEDVIQLSIEGAGRQELGNLLGGRIATRTHRLIRVHLGKERGHVGRRAEAEIGVIPDLQHLLGRALRTILEPRHQLASTIERTGEVILDEADPVGIGGGEGKGCDRHTPTLTSGTDSLPFRRPQG